MHQFIFSIAFCAALYSIEYASAQTYLVKKIPAASITVSGTGNSPAWSGATVLTDFIYPWEQEKPPATSFSALWDGQWLYCLFVVADDSINIYRVNNEKREAGRSDRVEIFFKADDKMSPYYCLEMDAAARTLDYSASFYRKMSYSWNWPTDQLNIKTSRTTTGYILEVAIGIPVLQQLGLLKNKQLQAGLFRAECTSIQNDQPNFKWISWIDPKTPAPDFHVPAAFGTLVLE